MKTKTQISSATPQCRTDRWRQRCLPSTLKIISTDWPFRAQANSGIFTPNLNTPVYSTNATLTFTMQSNLVLVARFENPFGHLRGIWSGLFAEQSDFKPRSAGYITWNMPGSTDQYMTLFSGKLLLDGKSYPFANRFAADGHSRVTILRYGLSSIAVDLYLDTNNFGNAATGVLAASDWTAKMVAYQSASKTNFTSAARYTMALAHQLTNSLPVPTGWGVGAISQTATGIIGISGSLADGQSYAPQTGTPSTDGKWPLFAQLYPNRQGILWGWLQFTNGDPGVLGNLSWYRPAAISTAYHAGFTTSATVIGSPYTNAFPLLNWTNGQVILTDNQRCDITNRVTLTNTSISILPDSIYRPTNGLSLVLSNSTGLITGKFFNPTTHSTNFIRGVLLQNRVLGIGNFGTTDAGAFLLQGD